jgi:hypothetical protein
MDIIKAILVILIGKRRETAPEVQKVLTEYGCIIKTRLGIHDGVMDQCANTGLLILELVGGSDQRKGFEDKLKAIKGVSVQLVELKLEGN